MKSFLFLFLIISFSVSAQKELPIHIDFNSGLSQSNSYQIAVFKLYITNISIEFEDESEYFEDKSYHLIDIQDTLSHSFTLAHVPDKKIKQLTLTIGTDSLANVSGALEGDLDPILGMYWAWNSGYINFKIEGKKDNQPFEYHIGGYNEDHATARSFTFAIKNDAEIDILLNPIAFLDQIDIPALHSVLIPGTEAIQLTAHYQKMIHVE